MHVVIVYASTGGNTELVAEQVASELRGRKHQVTLQRAELSDPRDLSKGDLFILASPTYGHGALEGEMEAFLGKVGDMRFDGKLCAVIGLGDPKYEPLYHIESAVILEKFLKDRGARLVAPALRISRSPVLFLDTVVVKWAEKLTRRETLENA